jgi:hypothetical protein
VSNLYDKKEIEELVEILAAYYPAAKKTIQVFSAIQGWAKRLEYPINSFTDLHKQAGTGESANLNFGALTQTGNQIITQSFNATTASAPWHRHGHALPMP